MISSMPSTTFALELLRLSTMTTLYPALISSTVVCEPINPVPPVTSIVCFISFYYYVSFDVCKGNNKIPIKKIYMQKGGEN